MKYFALILTLLFTFTANAFPKADISTSPEFVNPIFYQPLRPLSRQSGYAYLTPTTIKFSTIRDKDVIDETGQCKLLENKKNFIRLRCKTSWQMYDKGNLVTHTEDLIYTYEIKGYFLPTCLDIEEITYEIKGGDTKWNSTSHYCVAPPDSTSEPD